MRTWALPVVAGTILAAACVASDPCEGEVVDESGSKLLTAADGQFYVNTPAAAKDCHALFRVELWYEVEPAVLEPPHVTFAATAAAIDGTQGGLLGLLDAWTEAYDDQRDETYWSAGFDAGAKNIDAPAVTYGITGALLPGETRNVQVAATIGYKLPPEDTGEAAARCRR